MADKVYVGAIGVDIIVNCGEDISSATRNKIRMKKPDGKVVTLNADVYNANYLKYTTTKDDLILYGTYYVQADLSLGGWQGFGETDSFEIWKEFG